MCLAQYIVDRRVDCGLGIDEASSRYRAHILTAEEILYLGESFPKEPWRLVRGLVWI